MEHSFPFVVGSDGAGVIATVGSGVTDFRPRERVYGQFMELPKGQGSYAEFALVDAAGKVATIPDHLSFTLAAALPTATVRAEGPAAQGRTGVNLYNSATRQDLEDLAGLAADGKIRVRIDAEVALADAPSAVAHARSGQATGKTIIVP